MEVAVQPCIAARWAALLSSTSVAVVFKICVALRQRRKTPASMKGGRSGPIVFGQHSELANKHDLVTQNDLLDDRAKIEELDRVEARTKVDEGPADAACVEQALIDGKGDTFGWHAHIRVRDRG